MVLGVRFVSPPLIQVNAVFWLLSSSMFLQFFLLIQDGATAPAGDSAGPPVAAPEPANPVPSDPETVTGAPAGTSPEAEKGIPDAARAAQDATSPYLQFLPILIIGAFFYIILLRPQQREQRRRQELLNTLKKNDKVLTTGGMIGTIVDISTDGKMVTLRVDDTTRIKFLRTAIQGPLDDKTEASSPATS